MTPLTRHHAPSGIQHNKAWLAADSKSGVGRTSAQLIATVPAAPIFALFSLVVLADVLIYQVMPGASLALFFIALAAATHGFCFREVPFKTGISAWAILIISLLPSVDLVQFLSVCFAFGGLLAFVGVLSGGGGRAAAWAAIRFPVTGMICTVIDSYTLAQQPRHKGDAIAASLRDWIVPAILGLIFAGILIIANPVLDQWVSTLFLGRSLPLPQIDRIVFWIVLAPLIWPFLRLVRLRPSLLCTTPQTKAFGQVWYLTARSVTRALVLFNIIFAVQTVSDIAILWGEAALPEGMTYAQYAHRGAYPLLFAALLAGGFALLAQPFLSGRNALRALLLIWVAQTAMLVAASMLRLDLYIDAYGLTRMRFLAYIWMGIIGGGLVLMLWQTLRGFGPGWLMKRGAELALISTYCVALINVDGFVARHNLNKADGNSFFEQQLMYDGYMCRLGEGALPEIAKYNQKFDRSLCSYTGAFVSTPANWREWGYRNARVRRNLATSEGAAQ